MATTCSLLTTLWVAAALLTLGVLAGRGQQHQHQQHQLQKQHQQQKQQKQHQQQESKEARTNILLQEAVRQLLGIREGVNGTPEARPSALFPHPRDLQPPKYILDLYEKYKYSDFDRGQLRGNTVRSIHANIGEVNGEAMFLFNMSSVRPTEKVLSAEIHLYKRKRRSRKTDIDVVLYEIAPHYLSETGKVTMRNSAYGWQWYDVTEAVLSCLAARRVRPHLFALSFRGHRGDGKTKEVALRKFARHHSMPFLILYSNETSDINLDQMDKLAEALKSQMKHDAKAPSSSSSSSGGGSNGKQAGKKESSKANKSDPPAVVPQPPGDTSRDPKAEVSEGGQEKEESGERRVRRSVFTNEIPEDPADYKRFDYRFNLPQTHPGMLQARRESRHELSDHRLIPYPSEKRRRRRRKHRRRNRKRNRKNRNRHLKFPDEWEDFHDNVAAPDNNLSELCGRRKLIVDFADIGWGEWIISPKSFEAHYCAGTCPFPLTKRLRPSNHATIQSIVNAIGLYEHVPPPCCVPDAMSSVTLLYFDEDRNVVLKNYPAMTVQACACR